MIFARCPICNEDERLTALKFQSGIYRCNSCSHAFTIIPEERQEKYDADYFLKKHKNYFSVPNISLFNFIRRQISRLVDDEPIQLLDYGCGNGNFLKYMAAKNPGAKLFGIDLIDNPHHPRICFMRGDFLTENFGIDFNVICSIETIEHINEPYLFIQKMNQILRPKGFVFLSTINSASLIYRIAQLLDGMKQHKPFDRLYSFHHLQHYTNQSLKKLMEINGFAVILLKNYNPPLGSVDIPENNFFIEKVYRFFVWFIFLLSRILKCGMRQLVVCQKV
jgi:SAM-dependent methyltransferase